MKEPRRQIFFFVSLVLFPSLLLAAAKKESVVPSGLEFVRTLDVESYAERTNEHGRGSQTLRMRLRYLDPDVNAFVGMLTGLHHFNQDLVIGSFENPTTASVLWNWGADIGIKRGKHLWELDLMGVVAGDRLGPSLGIVGEHHFGRHWIFYHRTEFDLFTNDAILDADQGFDWQIRGPLELSAGYRWFTSLHTDRSGPHLGFILRFESPKIPFIFPSLG